MDAPSKGIVIAFRMPPMKSSAQRFRRIPKTDRTARVSQSRTHELIDFDSLTLLPCAADVTANGDGVGMAVAIDGIIAMLRGVLV
jgi:hypothetical protein